MTSAEVHNGEPLPSSYHIDKSDPDIVMLRREDGTFVAAFSALGATREGIVEAAREDYARLMEELARRRDWQTD